MLNWQQEQQINIAVNKIAESEKNGYKTVVITDTEESGRAFYWNKMNYINTIKLIKQNIQKVNFVFYINIQLLQELYDCYCGDFLREGVLIFGKALEKMMELIKHNYIIY
jgi:hypothetical protein